MSIKVETFRKILKFTSPFLAHTPAEIRLRLALVLRHKGIQTIFDPNSIRTFAKISTNSKFKVVTIENNTKIKVDINEIIGFRTFIDKTWDATCFLLTECIDPDKLVLIDVGANIGTTCIPVARRGSKIIAIEANPTTYAILIENLLMNKVSNYSALNIAMGATNNSGKWMDIISPLGNTGGSHVGKSSKEFLNQGLIRKCLMKTLDESLDFLGLFELTSEHKFIILKIDVEGYEPEVFRGGQRTIDHFRPVIIFEYTPSTYNSRNSKKNFWEKWREYELFSISKKLHLGKFSPGSVLLDVLAVPKEKKDQLAVFNNSSHLNR